MAKKVSKRASPKRAKAPGKKSSASAGTKTAMHPPRDGKGEPAVVVKKSPLARTELNEYRQMLLEKRHDLVGDMNGIQAEAFKNRQAGTGDLSNMPTHLADIGTDNFEHEFTLGLLESERVMLKEIDEALERISAGTYGICLGTGQPISKARLRARPWAKYCIEYARMLEKGLVHPPREEGQPAEETDEDAEEEEASDVEEAGEVEAVPDDDEE